MSRTRSLLCVAAVAVVVAWPNSARADFIEVLSQTYHIHGEAAGSSGVPITPPFSYDETSDSPLHRHDELTFFVSTPFGIVPGGVTLDATANSGITAASAFVEAWSFENDRSNAGGSATASASITFRPLESQLIVKREMGCCDPFFGLAAIYDETAGVTVLQYPIGWNGVTLGGSILIWLPVDVNHIYTMKTEASLASFAEFTHNIPPPDEFGARLRIEAVPEPASLSLIAAGLVVGLGILGRRLK